MTLFSGGETFLGRDIFLGKGDGGGGGAGGGNVFIIV